MTGEGEERSLSAGSAYEQSVTQKKNSVELLFIPAFSLFLRLRLRRSRCISDSDALLVFFSSQQAVVCPPPLV